MNANPGCNLHIRDFGAAESAAPSANAAAIQAALDAAAAKGGGFDIEDVVVKNSHFTGCRRGAYVLSNGGDKVTFGIRRIRFENCTFGGLPPMLESSPGVKFPLDPAEVVFTSTT